MRRTVPKILPLMPQNIPHELTELDQWAAWKWERRDGKWTKLPLNSATGRYARTNDPDTWGTFEAALRRMQRHRLLGIGFMFHPDDPFAGVDLDKCRDLETGKIESWALEIVEGLASYTEVSPSKTGLKVFVRGELPPGRRRKGQIEMYHRGRFFTTTGHHLAHTPATVNERQAELTRLHRQIFGAPTTKVAGGKRNAHETTAPGLSDSELIARAMRAKNGEKFARLWAGDTGDYRTAGNEGRSEADLALCSLLAFWCGPDEERIDRLFRQSGLYRKKWERADYRALTLALALDREEFWADDGVATLRRGKVYAWHRGVVSLG